MFNIFQCQGGQKHLNILIGAEKCVSACKRDGCSSLPFQSTVKLLVFLCSSCIKQLLWEPETGMELLLVAPQHHSCARKGHNVRYFFSRNI